MHDTSLTNFYSCILPPHLKLLRKTNSSSQKTPTNPWPSSPSKGHPNPNLSTYLTKQVAHQINPSYSNKNIKENKQVRSKWKPPTKISPKKQEKRIKKELTGAIRRRRRRGAGLGAKNRRNYLSSTRDETRDPFRALRLRRGSLRASIGRHSHLPCPAPASEHLPTRPALLLRLLRSPSHEDRGHGEEASTWEQERER